MCCWNSPAYNSIPFIEDLTKSCQKICYVLCPFKAVSDFVPFFTDQGFVNLQRLPQEASLFIDNLVYFIIIAIII
jgi:hypothetical protein